MFVEGRQPGDISEPALDGLTKSLTRNDARRINNLFVTPAKAGVQGKRLNSDPWNPACAGMTR
jgi:hypothetical protein